MLEAIFTIAVITASWLAQRVDSKEPGPGRPFCGAEASAAPPGLDRQSPQLRPRDEAPDRADLLAFRLRLQDAVSRKDAEAVLSVVDPDVRVDFGGGEGIEFFKSLMNDPNLDFWGEFGRVLAHGGTFQTPTEFSAPYIYSAWPSEFDAFECLAVTGRGVRLREAPGLNARTLAVVEFAIVQALPNEPDIPGWTRVRLASGRTGYIASEYVRSPVGYRAHFAFKAGRWWLVAFVAGD